MYRRRNDKGPRHKASCRAPEYPHKIWFREYVKAQGHEWPVTDGLRERLLGEWKQLPLECSCGALQTSTSEPNGDKTMTKTNTKNANGNNTTKGAKKSAKQASKKGAATAAAATKGAAKAGAKGAAKAGAKKAGAAKGGTPVTEQVLAIINKRTKSNPIARTELSTLEQKMAVLRLAANGRIGKVEKEGRTFYYGLPQKGGAAKGKAQASATA